MKTPRSKLRGIKDQRQKTSKQFQLDFLVMKPFIVLLSPLILHIPADDFFTTMTSYRTDKVAFGPKFTTPQLLFHRGNAFENLSCRDTFDGSDNLCWTIARHRLQKEMDVILVGPNFQKDNLVPFSDFQTDVLECGINLLVKDNTTVLGWTNQVVDQHGDIVALMNIFAHTSYDITPESSEASFGESDPQRLNWAASAQTTPVAGTSARAIRTA
jgi:hypothetical protein